MKCRKDHFRRAFNELHNRKKIFVRISFLHVKNPKNKRNGVTFFVTV
jgi:hypothetical protein